MKDTFFKELKKIMKYNKPITISIASEQRFGMSVYAMQIEKRYIERWGGTNYV